MSDFELGVPTIGEVKTKPAADAAPKPRSKFEIGVPMMNEAEAKVAAKSRAKQLKRDTITASCDVVGDPSIRAGADLTFERVRAGVDGKKFVITTVRHSFSKRGYTTSIEAELKV